MKACWTMVVLGWLTAGCAVPTVSSPDEDKSAGDDAAAQHASDIISKGKLSAGKPKQSPEDEEEPAADATDIYYLAAVDQLPRQAFGHSSSNGAFCYVTFFSNVRINARTTADGKLRTISFAATSNEELNDASCNVTPRSPNEQLYTFSTQTPSDKPASLVPAPGNNPQATLTADFSASSSRVTLHWHRTDVSAPWDWEFTRQVTLTRTNAQ